MTKKEREILQAVIGHLVIARDAIDIGLNGKLLISATDIRKHGITMALGLLEEELKVNNSHTT